MKLFNPKFGGHRLYLDDFTHIQSSYKQIGKALSSVFQVGDSYPIRLSGIEMNRIVSMPTTPISAPTLSHLIDQDFLIPLITDTGYSSVEGVEFYIPSTIGGTIEVNNTIYTKGYVYFNGEIYYSPGGFVKASSVGGGMISVPDENPFFRIIELETPIDPIEYADGSLKNYVHTDRIILVKKFNSSEGDIDGVNGFLYQNTSTPKVNFIQKGMIMDWEETYVNEINDVFDSTGLGIGRMAGWAICNGLNSTNDLRGQFTVMASINMKNSALPPSHAISSLAVRSSIGAASRMISVGKVNLPNYTLPVTVNPHNHSTNIKYYQVTAEETLKYEPFPPIIPSRFKALKDPSLLALNKTLGGSGFGDHKELIGGWFTKAYDTTSPPVFQNLANNTSSETVVVAVSSGGSGTPINTSTIPPAFSTVKIKRIF